MIRQYTKTEFKLRDAVDRARNRLAETCEGASFVHFERASRRLGDYFLARRKLFDRFGRAVHE